MKLTEISRKKDPKSAARHRTVFKNADFWIGDSKESSFYGIFDLDVWYDYDSEGDCYLVAVEASDDSALWHDDGETGEILLAGTDMWDFPWWKDKWNDEIIDWIDTNCRDDDEKTARENAFTPPDDY